MVPKPVVDTKNLVFCLFPSDLCKKRMMEISYKIMLFLHVVSGFLALLCGSIAIISKKGGKLHKTVGKVFFMSMLSVCFTSVIISVAKSNQFLLLIGVFAFYLNYVGYRAIKEKALKPNRLDWLVLLMAAVNSLFMAFSMNVILMVFAGISFFTLVQVIRTNISVLQNKPIEELLWLQRHIGMMMGAFISTITAFLVVNSNYLNQGVFPTWLVWLAPTFILMPLSIYYTNKYVIRKIKIKKVKA
jgi:uncharacterized membrane protein